MDTTDNYIPPESELFFSFYVYLDSTASGIYAEVIFRCSPLSPLPYATFENDTIQELILAGNGGFMRGTLLNCLLTRTNYNCSYHWNGGEKDVSLGIHSNLPTGPQQIQCNRIPLVENDTVEVIVLQDDTVRVNWRDRSNTFYDCRVWDGDYSWFFPGVVNSFDCPNSVDSLFTIGIIPWYYSFMENLVSPTHETGDFELKNISYQRIYVIRKRITAHTLTDLHSQLNPSTDPGQFSL